MSIITATGRSLKWLVLSAVMLLLPSIVFCQALPDAPPEVPFDDNMNLFFLAVGILFAAVIVGREIYKKRVSKI
jgi:hypothetical protein